MLVKNKVHSRHLNLSSPQGMPLIPALQRQRKWISKFGTSRVYTMSSRTSQGYRETVSEKNNSRTSRELLQHKLSSPLATPTLPFSLSPLSTLKKITLNYLCVCTHAMCTQGDQRTSCTSLFFPSTTWFLGIKVIRFGCIQPVSHLDIYLPLI